jgi:ABC-type glucose/galactose transport system permease subunit
MTDGEAPADVSWRPSGRQVGMAALLALVVLFALLNLDDAKVDFLVDSVKVPLVFVIAVTAILSFFAGYLFTRHLDKRD